MAPTNDMDVCGGTNGEDHVTPRSDLAAVGVRKIYFLLRI